MATTAPPRRHSELPTDLCPLTPEQEGVAELARTFARDAGLPAATEAATAKLSASETAAYRTWAAVQTLGGWGYSREYPVEQWMRDAELEEIEEGTSDIMRLVISRGLGRC